MKSEQIKSVIIEIMSRQFSVDETEITEYTNIIDDFGADSLDIVELLMEIEDNLNITIPDADVLELKTINDVVDYISRQIPEMSSVLEISST